MTTRILLLTVLLVLVAAASTVLGVSTATSLPKLTLKDGKFVDSEGRIQMLHGINIRNTEGVPSISQEQMQVGASWGFRVVRVAFMWHLYEVAPGVYNDTFLDTLEAFVDELGENGYYAILDMHQDMWSPMFCSGHGIPEFYGQPYNDSRFWENGPLAFPQPITDPEYTTPDKWSGKFGKVDGEACAKISSQGPVGWASSYLTYAMSAAAQRLYDNDGGVLDAFAKFWTRMAQRFAGKGHVLAYELINEPWLGNVYANYSLLSAATVDRDNLQPMYERLHQAIRTVDNDTVIFFEPATGGNILDALPVGFTAGPGGVSFNNRQALSFHIYCPLLETDLPFKPSQKSKEVMDAAACTLLNSAQFEIRAIDVARLGVGGFLTEFGAQVPDTFGLDMLDLAMNKADSTYLSWAYWYLHINTTAPNYEAKTLARTYARQLSASSVMSSSFDMETGHFSVTYAPPSSSSPLFAVPHEVFASKQFYYPNGVAFLTQPAGALNMTTSGDNLLLFTHTSVAASASEITLIVHQP